MGKNSKIFITCVIVCICIFSYTGYKGKIQIQQREKDYNLYLSVKERTTNSIDLDNALEDLDYLIDNYSESDVLSLDKALIYKEMGKYNEAQESIEKVFKLNSTLENNVTLLTLYADITYENKDIKKSKEILNNIQNLNISQDDLELVNKLIEKIG